MGLYNQDDTICAIATPVGEGAIGIIKISGRDAASIAQRLFRSKNQTFPLKPQRLYYGWIVSSDGNHIIDEVLLSYMAAPHSYTREDVVEINCHSGYAVLKHILDQVLNAGARLAEPGEFTRRAFLNGRIDLTQAEAVADLIRCQSEQSLLLANRNLRGHLKENVESWHESICQIEAEIEARIDFSEDLDDHEENISNQTLLENLQISVLEPLQEVLDHYQQCRILREGFTLVLVGKANVGKSSLLNALLKKDRAIVTCFPGTTRDIIEDSFLISGVQVRILDTAGIRHQPDTIEALGIERTRRAIEEADAVLWMLDLSRPLDDEDQAVFGAISHKKYVVLMNKADLPHNFDPQEIRQRFMISEPIVSLSVLNPRDIEQLRRSMVEWFLQDPLHLGQSMISVNARHRQCLQEAQEALKRAEKVLAEGNGWELASFELGLALRQLEAILGWERDDELLDRIFSQFCIGK